MAWKPPHLKHIPEDTTELDIGIHDAFLIYHPDDYPWADKYRHYMRETCGNVQILLFGDPAVVWVSSDFQQFAKGMEKSAYTFLFITDNFSKSNFYTTMAADTLVLKTITETQLNNTLFAIRINNTPLPNSLIVQTQMCLEYWFSADGHGTTNARCDDKLQRLLSESNPKLVNLMTNKTKMLEGQRMAWIDKHSPSTSQNATPLNEYVRQEKESQRLIVMELALNDCSLGELHNNACNPNTGGVNLDTNDREQAGNPNPPPRDAILPEDETDEKEVLDRPFEKSGNIPTFILKL